MKDGPEHVVSTRLLEEVRAAIAAIAARAIKAAIAARAIIAFVAFIAAKAFVAFKAAVATLSARSASLTSILILNASLKRILALGNL